MPSKIARTIQTAFFLINLRPLADSAALSRRSLDELLTPSFYRSPPLPTPLPDVTTFQPAFGRPTSAYEMLPYLHALKRNADFPFRPYYSGRNAHAGQRGLTKRVGTAQPDWGYVLTGTRSPVRG